MDSYFGDGYCLAQDPLQPHVAYAGGTHLDSAASLYKMAVCKTQDGGATWGTRRDLTAGAGVCRDLAVAPSNSGVVYAVGEEGAAGRVFRSGNAGQTWSNVTNNLATFHSATWQVLAVCVHPADANRVHVGTSKGCYVSNNGGQTWAETGLTRSPKAFAYDSVAGVLYAVVENHGVHFTRDGGKTWQEMNQGLGTLNGLCLAINPMGRVLFLGTDSGVWRANLIGPAQARPQWNRYR